MSEVFTVGGGGNSAKLKDKGDTVEGKILRVKKTQQTNFKTKEPEFYKDGNPKTQFVVTLDTEDGEQDIFIKGALHFAFKKLVDSGEWNGELAPGTGIKVRRETEAGSLEPEYRIKVTPPAPVSMAAAKQDDTEEVPF